MSGLDVVRVGTLPNKYFLAISSFDGPHLDKEGHPFTPTAQTPRTLRDVVDTQFSTDEHMTCYTVREAPQWPLIKKAALASVEALSTVEMQVLCFDWDCPNHSPWTAELFIEFFDKLLALDTHSYLGKWACAYTSRHGARILYALDTPVSVTIAEELLAGMFRELETHGLKVDEGCKDWTRRFRCPRVIREGHGDSTKEPFFDILTRDEFLPLAHIPRLPKRVIPALKQAPRSLTVSQPAHDEIDRFLLTDKGTQSAFFKDVKKALKNVQAAAPFLSPDIPLASQGSRNDAIMKALGAIIPILIKQIAYLTPQHVYALTHGAVSALDRDQDWFGHTWNAILTIYPVEIAKYNAQKQREADKELMSCNMLEELSIRMSEWCDAPQLTSCSDSQEFIKRHLFANFETTFFALGQDGCYCMFPIKKEQLIPRIRTTFLDDIVITRELSAMGKQVDVPVATIQNNYSTIIREIQLVPQLEKEGTIVDMDGNFPVMRVPMYRRNPNLEPTFNQDVDAWLELFFGYHYERGCDWIANALAFEEGPICGLSISAPPGIGKKLLMEGLAECLERPSCASGKDAVEGFNGELAKTPFLNVNESWPTSKGGAPFEVFKQLTAGDRVEVEEKFKARTKIMNPVRVVLTANNHDLVRFLLSGKEMTPADREAIGQRLLHFDLTGAAAVHLDERGGNAFTGRSGNRWISGISEESNYIVAKHFLWLWANREPRSGTFHGRFLVEGNMAGSTFMQHRITERDTVSQVCTAAINMIERASHRPSYIIRKEDGAVLVTIDAIQEELKAAETPMEFGLCSSVMRNIVLNTDPVVYGGVEHHILDCNILETAAKKRGRQTPRLRAILGNQILVKNNSVQMK